MVLESTFYAINAFPYSAEGAHCSEVFLCVLLSEDVVLQYLYLHEMVHCFISSQVGLKVIVEMSCLSDYPLLNITKCCAKHRYKLQY
jgi:hypothetical protein